jgi:hypothetical protein
VAAFWAAAEARDWDALVRGRQAYLRFNAEGFAYEWHLQVRRILGDGAHGASWVDVAVPDGTDTGVCFFDLDEDGLISEITDFWPMPYDLPASRAHLVERY